jgi:hypothetical protein
VIKPFDKDADESEERPQYGVGGGAFQQATVFDVLQSLPREALIQSIEPPEHLAVCHWPIWCLAKTLTTLSANQASARVSAAKELLDRLYGKVPVVERIENVPTIESLDLSRLTPLERQSLRSLLEKTQR